MDEHRNAMSRRRFLKGAAAGAGVAALGPAAAAGAVTPAAEPRTLLGGAVTGALKLARVSPASRAEAIRLANGGFDDTHRVFDDGSIELLLWPGDEARLDGLGIRYSITVSDLIARDAARLEAARGRAVTTSAPGMRDTYRTLEDYNEDLRLLADEHPDKVRLFALPVRSLEERTVYGVEICTDVDRRDGRPVCYLDGLHHAREWPSGELAIMFAFDLVERYGEDSRITNIVDHVRMVIVPVCNPDGFVRSRDALTSTVHNETPLSVPLLVSEFQYHRKNMRRHENLPEETGAGIDTNRNYGFHWGGTGSSGSKTSQTYRGAAPFSEPSAEAVRQLLNRLQPVTLNSGHTHGGMVLRPLGWTMEPAPDEWALKPLGDAMAEATGYRSMVGPELYPTTGTTLDWGYGALGALAYTFEYATAFHPPYEDTFPDLYTDISNREAFLILAEAALDVSTHSVLTGRVVGAGGGTPATVRVRKAFETMLWEDGSGDNPIGQATYPEWCDLRAETGGDGTFRIHLNPSRRPFEDEPGEPYTVSLVTEDGRSAEKLVRVARGETADLGALTLT